MCREWGKATSCCRSQVCSGHSLCVHWIILPSLATVHRSEPHFSQLAHPIWTQLTLLCQAKLSKRRSHCLWQTHLLTRSWSCPLALPLPHHASVARQSPEQSWAGQIPGQHIQALHHPRGKPHGALAPGPGGAPEGFPCSLLHSGSTPGLMWRARLVALTLTHNTRPETTPRPETKWHNEPLRCSVLLFTVTICSYFIGIANG